LSMVSRSCPSGWTNPKPSTVQIFATMKTLNALLILLLASSSLWAKTENLLFDIPAIEPGEDYENIHVQELTSNAHATQYLIWVKDEVKPHYHEKHTETIYVVAGSGIMAIGEEGKRIGPGTMLVIPPNTVHAVEVTSDTPLKVISVQTPQFHGQDRHFTEGE